MSLMKNYTKERFSLTVRGMEICHDYYTSSADGPVIVLLHELPGLTPKTMELARALTLSGFRVVLPHYLGPLGKDQKIANTLRVCISKEIRCLAEQGGSPFVDWLRAFCQAIKTQQQVSGIGVIGMCLTGNFAISLIASPAVLGAVTAQPSLPFLKQSSLALSPQEIEDSKAALDQKGYMLGYRYTDDKICQEAKFEAIEQHFTSDQICLNRIDGNSHSTLTDRVFAGDQIRNEAVKEVIDYFKQRLPENIQNS